jgi:hypothetical protein
MSCQPIAGYEREIFSAGCTMNIGLKKLLREVASTFCGAQAGATMHRRCSRDRRCADGPMPEVYHRTQSTPACPPHDSGGPQRREETSQQSPQTLRLYCRRYSYNLARLSRGKSRSWVTSVANPWEKERPNSGGQGATRGATCGPFLMSG